MYSDPPTRVGMWPTPEFRLYAGHALADERSCVQGEVRKLMRHSVLPMAAVGPTYVGGPLLVQLLAPCSVATFERGWNRRRRGCRRRLRISFGVDSQNLDRESPNFFPALAGQFRHVLSHQDPAITAVMDDGAHELRFTAKQEPGVLPFRRKLAAVLPPPASWQVLRDDDGTARGPFGIVRRGYGGRFSRDEMPGLIAAECCGAYGNN